MGEWRQGNCTFQGPSQEDSVHQGSGACCKTTLSKRPKDPHFHCHWHKHQKLGPGKGKPKNGFQLSTLGVSEQRPGTLQAPSTRRREGDPQGSLRVSKGNPWEDHQTWVPAIYTPMQACFLGASYRFFSGAVDILPNLPNCPDPPLLRPPPPRPQRVARCGHSCGLEDRGERPQPALSSPASTRLFRLDSQSIQGKKEYPWYPPKKTCTDNLAFGTSVTRNAPSSSLRGSSNVN